MSIETTAEPESSLLKRVITSPYTAVAVANQEALGVENRSLDAAALVRQ